MDFRLTQNWGNDMSQYGLKACGKLAGYCINKDNQMPAICREHWLRLKQSITDKARTTQYDTAWLTKHFFVAYSTECCNRTARIVYDVKRTYEQQLLKYVELIETKSTEESHKKDKNLAENQSGDDVKKDSCIHRVIMPHIWDLVQYNVYRYTGSGRSKCDWTVLDVNILVVITYEFQI